MRFSQKIQDSVAGIRDLYIFKEGKMKNKNLLSVKRKGKRNPKSRQKYLRSSGFQKSCFDGVRRCQPASCPEYGHCGA
jgi:hypothetical protein